MPVRSSRVPDGGGLTARRCRRGARAGTAPRTRRLRRRGLPVLPTPLHLRIIAITPSGQRVENALLPALCQGQHI